MPLTSKGRKVKAAMEEQYGKERGNRVFYATENKGKMKNLTKKTKKMAMGGMAGGNPTQQMQYNVPQMNPYSMNKPVTMAKGGMTKAPTFKTLREAAEAGYHGKTVNIEGKGAQKVSFADKAYDKRMAEKSKAKATPPKPKARPAPPKPKARPQEVERGITTTVLPPPPSNDPIVRRAQAAIDESKARKEKRETPYVSSGRGASNPATQTGKEKRETLYVSSGRGSASAARQQTKAAREPVATSIYDAIKRRANNSNKNK